MTGSHHVMNSLSCFTMSLQKTKLNPNLFPSYPVFYKCRLRIKVEKVRSVRKDPVNYVSMLSYRCRLHSYIVTNQSSGLVMRLLWWAEEEWWIVGKELDKRGEKGMVMWGQFGEVKWEEVLWESFSKIWTALGIGAGGISTDEGLSFLWDMRRGQNSSPELSTATGWCVWGSSPMTVLQVVAPLSTLLLQSCSTQVFGFAPSYFIRINFGWHSRRSVVVRMLLVLISKA